MVDNPYGCAADAVSIRRNACLAIFPIDIINISDLQNIKIFTSSVCVTSYLSNESKNHIDLFSETHLNTGLKNASLTLVQMVPTVFLSPPIFEQILWHT